MSEQTDLVDIPMACPLCGSPIHKSETIWIASGRWATIYVTFGCQTEWRTTYNFREPDITERPICVTRQRDQLQAQLGLKKEAEKSSGGASTGERGYDV